MYGIPQIAAMQRNEQREGQDSKLREIFDIHGEENVSLHHHPIPSYPITALIVSVQAELELFMDEWYQKIHHLDLQCELSQQELLHERRALCHRVTHLSRSAQISREFDM